MTLVEQIAAVNARIDSLTTMNITDAEALAFGHLNVKVAELTDQMTRITAALQTVIHAQATQAAALAALGQRLDRIEGGLGDLSAA